MGGANSTPVYFTPPLKGSPWNSVPTLGVKKLELWGYQARKKFDDIFCRLHDTIHQCDRHIDGQTDIGRQQRPHLYIASRAKNGIPQCCCFQVLVLVSGSAIFQLVLKSRLLSIRLLPGLSRTVSGINGDFLRKSPIFPPPCIYSPRWNWVSA